MGAGREDFLLLTFCSAAEKLLGQQTSRFPAGPGINSGRLTASEVRQPPRKGSKRKLLRGDVDSGGSSRIGMDSSYCWYFYRDHCYIFICLTI